VRGHYLSHLDPLEISSANLHMEPDGKMPKFLDHKTYGFSDADLDREFYMGEAAIGAASAGVMAADRSVIFGTSQVFLARCCGG